MAITPSDFSKIWASNADTPEYTFSDTNYLKGWDFVGNLPPTRAQWNAIQKSTDEKMKYVFDNFGAPLTASTVAEMTLQNRVYVYTGSETGYTAGHWYYWNGSAWTDGGVYNSTAFNTDPTLTISGAAADAKATGDAIANTQTEMSLFGAKDFLWQTTYDGNSRTQNGVTYTVDSSAKTVAMNGTASALSFYRFYNSTSAIPAGMTIGKTYVAEINTDLNCSLQIFPYVNGSLGSSIVKTSSQVLFTIPEGTEGLLIRINVAKDNTVHGTVRPLIAEAFSLAGLFMGGSVSNKGILDKRTDVNTVTDTSIRYLTDNYTYTNIPLSLSYGGSAYLSTYHPINTPHILQTITYVGKKLSYMRKNISGTWGDWETSINNGIALSNNTDIDTLTDTGVYFLSDTHTYNNAPVAGESFLLTSYKVDSSLGLNMQIAYGFSRNQYIYRRGRAGSGSWSAWTVIGGGSGGTVYNNTYEFNEYQSTNTYNVTPTITTDTHNFLAPTGDATDRKGAIETLLSTNGICHLAPGEFYVSGIDMPTYSKLMGCGNATKIILLGTDSTDGYAVKMDTGCVVSDMLIAGNSQYHIDDSSSYPSATEYVQRHGILWQGNASGDNNHIPKIGTINNCYICNFTGGGITGYDSGMSILSGLSVSNCYIWYCHSGVNMRYLTEFSKFTNVSANRCHYGCVANGGNLVFVNCNFSANICGLLMDDSTGQSPNNSHGSFIGCTFDHSDGNAGYAMMLYGLDHGEIFSGCQVFFGKTLIDDCKGVRFVGGNYGRQTDITINDSFAVTYDSCQFRASSETQVNLTGNTGVFFNNCLLYEGTVFNPV